MRPLLLVLQLELLLVFASATRPSVGSYTAPPSIAIDRAHGTASPVKLDEGGFAWVVQTGRGTAEAAVSAIMTTFLQEVSEHTGFVADTESTGKIKLADTVHKTAEWSLARWEDARLRNGHAHFSDSDAQAEPGSLTPHHPFYPHGAHKVLPGFNLMHAQWPNASWYIMIDDDTFIFRRSLASLLSSLDPHDSHYIGYPRSGAQMCSKDVSSPQHRDQPDGPFALGGCGMVLSKGALNKFTKVVRDCTVISQDCYLDDVRLFYCLRDIDIHLNTLFEYPAMNFAPNKNIDWGQVDPCQRPVAFHGVVPMEMHMLHQADLKYHGKATMADIFGEMSNWSVHSERLGARYSSQDLVSNITGTLDLRECRMRCEKQANCKAWNFANQEKYCELVGRLTPPEEDWRFTSGISQPAYQCHLPGIQMM